MAETLTQTEIFHFFDEIKLLYKETDRKFQETDRLMREQSQETERLMREQSKETDRKFQETERLMREQSKKTDKKIKEVSTAIGRLGGRLGDFIEEMVKPAAVRLFRQRGIEVHEVSRNIISERGGDSIEIDLLVVNDSEMIVIECKSKLSVEDVNDHLKRLGKVKKLMPKYADMHVMGAVAAMVLQKNVAQYAYRQGLFVLAQSGDTMEIRNDEKFQPGIW